MATIAVILKEITPIKDTLGSGDESCLSLSPLKFDLKKGIAFDDVRRKAHRTELVFPLTVKNIRD